MASLEQDIEIMRGLARNRFEAGDWVWWLLASVILLVWRIAWWMGVR